MALEKVGVQAVIEGLSPYLRGADQIESATGKMGTASTQAAEKTNKLTSMLGTAAVAAGGAVAAYLSFSTLKGALDEVEALGQSVLKLKRETGLSAEAASELIFAFKHVGLDSDSASVALGIFAKKLKGVQDEETGVTTGGKSTGQILADVGIKATDASGNLRPMDQLLFEIADKFKSMPDGIEKTGLAMQLFGRSGKNMIPLLNQGSAGLADLATEAKKLGVVLSTDNVEAIRQYSFAQRDMNEALTGLKLELAQGVLPKLTQLMTLLTDLQPVARAAAKVINENFLVTLGKNMTPALGFIVQFAAGVNNLSAALGGNKGAAEEAAAAMDDGSASTQTATDQFKAQTDTVSDLSTQLKGLDDALEKLAGQETAEEVALHASSAALDEQIKWREAWVAGGGALTEQQYWEYLGWKNQKAALDAQTDAIKASKEAYVSHVEALQGGRTTLGGVKDQIDGATLAYLGFGSAVVGATEAINSCTVTGLLTGLQSLATAADTTVASFEDLRRVVSTALPGQLTGFEGYQFGGLVPGPIGQPQVAIVHGGEEIRPGSSQMTGLSGMSVLPALGGTQVARTDIRHQGNNVYYYGPVTYVQSGQQQESSLTALERWFR